MPSTALTLPFTIYMDQDKYKNMNYQKLSLSLTFLLRCMVSMIVHQTSRKSRVIIQITINIQSHRHIYSHNHIKNAYINIYTHTII